MYLSPILKLGVGLINPGLNLGAGLDVRLGSKLCLSSGLDLHPGHGLCLVIYSGPRPGGKNITNVDTLCPRANAAARGRQRFLLLF